MAKSEEGTFPSTIPESVTLYYFIDFKPVVLYTLTFPEYVVMTGQMTATVSLTFTLFLGKVWTLIWGYEKAGYIFQQYSFHIFSCAFPLRCIYLLPVFMYYY